MNNLSANLLRVTGKNKAINNNSGSIITNGGVACNNIFCETDIIANNLVITDSLQIQNDININGKLNLKMPLLPYNNLLNIGSNNNRWNNIFAENLDIKNNAIFSNDNKIIMEIRDKININSDVNILNNNVKINGNFSVNNIFDINENKSININNTLNTEDIIINKYLSIIPDYVIIDKEDFIVNITSSVMILTIKNNSSLSFKIIENINNILIKLIFINYGDYDVEINADNRDIITKTGCELFIVYNNHDNNHDNNNKIYII